MPDIEFYPQTLSTFGADLGCVRGWYDVILFYNYHQEKPGHNRNKWGQVTKEALENLSSTHQGIVLLHHSLVAFPGWRFWSSLTGITSRSFQPSLNQRIRIEIANPEHPVVKGLAPWDMVDELYLMESPGSDCTALLTTNHPQSMRTIAWTKENKLSRTFCFQSGHCDTSYSNQNFQTVLARGISWAAHRL